MHAMDHAIQMLTVYALPVLFAITLHEAAHAYAAKFFGDATAYVQGRMSLNPVRHIDPFGTIILPVLLFLIGTPFLIGYAKPVPVDFSRLRNPKRDMAWVALAGPAANLIMAFGWLVFSLLLNAAHVSEPFFIEMAEAGVRVNLIIFAFNLFPLPPLDGGRILTSLLPKKYAYRFARIEPYGFVILLALVYFQTILMSYWVVPVAGFGDVVIRKLASPLNILLS
jgi:Zn-dependent protease